MVDGDWLVNPYDGSREVIKDGDSEWEYVTDVAGSNGVEGNLVWVSLLGDWLRKG